MNSLPSPYFDPWNNTCTSSFAMGLPLIYIHGYQITSLHEVLTITIYHPYL